MDIDKTAESPLFGGVISADSMDNEATFACYSVDSAAVKHLPLSSDDEASFMTPPLLCEAKPLDTRKRKRVADDESTDVVIPSVKREKKTDGGVCSNGACSTIEDPLQIFTFQSKSNTAEGDIYDRLTSIEKKIEACLFSEDKHGPSGVDIEEEERSLLTELIEAMIDTNSLGAKAVECLAILQSSDDGLCLLGELAVKVWKTAPYSREQCQRLFSFFLMEGARQVRHPRMIESFLNNGLQCVLKAEQLLGPVSERCLKTLIPHKHNELLSFLYWLIDNHNLSKGFCQSFAEHPQIESIHFIVCKLHEHGFLTRERVIALLEYKGSLCQIDSLELIRNNICVKDNRPLIRSDGKEIICFDIDFLGHIFTVLNGAHSVSPEDRDALINAIKEDEIWDTYVILEILCNSNLLDKNCLKDVLDSNSCLAELKDALELLEVNELLNRDRVQRLTSLDDPEALARGFVHLHFGGLLNEANTAALYDQRHQFLISREGKEMIWYRLPCHLFNQPIFDQLVSLSEQQEPAKSICQYVQRLIGDDGSNVFMNGTQSVHRSSVHRSASESALALKQCYGEFSHGKPVDEAMIKRFPTLFLECDRGGVINNAWLISKIHEWAGQLPDSTILSDKKAVAERFITMNLSNDSGSMGRLGFIDRDSGVRTWELLLFTFLGIHDQDKWAPGVTYSAANTAFIQGLYEIQRGYNLDKQGKDQGGDDKTACAAGTFVKLINSLQGCHQCCVIKFVTKEQATLKCQCLVKQEIKKIAPEATTITDELWFRVKDKVEEALLDEFGELYGHDKTHPDFVALLDSWEYVALTDDTEQADEV